MGLKIGCESLTGVFQTVSPDTYGVATENIRYILHGKERYAYFSAHPRFGERLHVYGIAIEVVFFRCYKVVSCVYRDFRRRLLAVEYAGQVVGKRELAHVYVVRCLQGGQTGHISVNEMARYEDVAAQVPISANCANIEYVIGAYVAQG